MVRLPELRRDPEVLGLPEAAELRDLPGDAWPSTGSLRQAREFLHASGKLQALCYKEEIESALRTPGMGGLQLLDLHDFPGQGTALVGVLDAFWEEKGYISPAEYRRFAGPTVPLARLAKRVFTVDETLEAEIEVTHFGAEPLAPVAPTWRLVTSGGATLADGVLPAREIPLGSATQLGRVVVRLTEAPAPVQAKLVVSLPGTEATNDWDVWIYPRAVAVKVPPNVLQADRLDDGTARPTRGRGDGLPLDPAEQSETRPEAGADRPRLLEHLLEHGLDQPAGATHARHPLRPEASRALALPHRGPQQLAVVVPRDERRTDDPRRLAAGAAAASCR